MNLANLERQYLKLRTEYAMRSGQKLQLDRQVEEARKEAVELIKRQELYTKVQELLLKASETARGLVKEKVENLVTLALSAITGESYKFGMSLIQHAGNWSVEFSVTNPSGVTVDPLHSAGGGIVDICSMALRIAILEMYEPRIEGPILLDEDFKFLSKDYVRPALDWIKMLIEKTGRQIILVTHEPLLAAGANKVFEVIPQGNISIVKDITNIENKQMDQTLKEFINP
jgi:DNA repair exonuclease SbcCD ATPase subunit